MADQYIQVELCAPDKAPICCQAVEVNVPGSEGFFTVQPDHTPLLTLLQPGVVAIEVENGEPRHFAVSGGFAEVKNNQVLILADVFEPGDEIDIDRATAARERAEQIMQKPQDDSELALAEMALARSLARIRAREGQTF